jgi:hypothetical protein
MILPSPRSIKPTGPIDRLRLLSALVDNRLLIGFFEKIFLLMFLPCSLVKNIKKEK